MCVRNMVAEWWFCMHVCDVHMDYGAVSAGVVSDRFMLCVSAGVGSRMLRPVARVNHSE